MSLPDKMPIEEAKRHAAEWGVTSRTIYTWKRAGVDFSNKFSVCAHIATLRNPSHAALRTALEVLNPEHQGTP